MTRGIQNPKIKCRDKGVTFIEKNVVKTYALLKNMDSQLKLPENLLQISNFHRRYHLNMWVYLKRINMKNQTIFKKNLLSQSLNNYWWWKYYDALSLYVL